MEQSIFLLLFNLFQNWLNNIESFSSIDAPNNIFFLHMKEFIGTNFFQYLFFNIFKDSGKTKGTLYTCKNLFCIVFKV